MRLRPFPGGFKTRSTDSVHGQIYKSQDNAPALVLRNVVIASERFRDPSGDGPRLPERRGRIADHYEDVTLVWLGTRPVSRQRPRRVPAHPDPAVYEDAVADWKARHGVVDEDDVDMDRLHRSAAPSGCSAGRWRTARDASVNRASAHRSPAATAVRDPARRGSRAAAAWSRSCAPRSGRPACRTATGRATTCSTCPRRARTTSTSSWTGGTSRVPRRARRLRLQAGPPATPGPPGPGGGPLLRPGRADGDAGPRRRPGPAGPRRRHDQERAPADRAGLPGLVHAGAALPRPGAGVRARGARRAAGPQARHLGRGRVRTGAAARRGAPGARVPRRAGRSRTGCGRSWTPTCRRSAGPTGRGTTARCWTASRSARAWWRGAPSSAAPPT